VTTLISWCVSCLTSKRYSTYHTGLTRASISWLNTDLHEISTRPKCELNFCKAVTFAIRNRFWRFIELKTSTINGSNSRRRQSPQLPSECIWRGEIARRNRAESSLVTDMMFPQLRQYQSLSALSPRAEPTKQATVKRRRFRTMSLYSIGSKNVLQQVLAQYIVSFRKTSFRLITSDHCVLWYLVRLFNVNCMSNFYTYWNQFNYSLCLCCLLRVAPKRKSYRIVNVKLY